MLPSPPPLTAVVASHVAGRFVLLGEIDLPVVVLSAAGFAAALIGFIAIAKSFLHICQPNEVLIFTGRRRMRDGVDLGPLIILPHGRVDQAEEYSGGGRGRKWRIPVLERVDRMDVRAMSIDVVVHNAYSAGNIPLRIHAIANVKIHTDPKRLRNAIERFLGRSRDEIKTVAQQTLEGAVREVLAQMTPEQVNEDRLTFADNLIKSAKDDLDKLGLQLDTLKIQNVSDETGYLDSLGRPAIARALRDAENAENQAMQEISQAQAAAKQASDVAKAEAETATASRRNELARVRAELSGEAEAVEREAVAAARTARAQAEQELQRVRSELEQLRLQADVVLPAQAAREAAAIAAVGAAAPTVEQGKALIEVLAVTTDAWKAMGGQAREIYVIQHLEPILGAVVNRLKSLEVGEVSVLDPGDGSGLASYAAAYPQAVAAVLRALAETTGVDVPAILSRSSEATPATPPPAAPLPSGPRSPAASFLPTAPR
jgi:flotillin